MTKQAAQLARAKNDDKTGYKDYGTLTETKPKFVNYKI
jgi:hypothetical protein